MIRVIRRDQGEFRKPRRLANGMLEVDAVIAKVGILEYLKDGKIFSEFVSPDALKDPVANATLARTTLTNSHPPSDVDVDAENFRRYAVGELPDIQHIKFDESSGELRAFGIIVRDAAAIEDVESGKVGISPGYKTRVIMQPGEWMGQKYDAFQSGRQYNHTSIVDDPRGGAGVAIRLDSRYDQMDPNRKDHGHAKPKKDEVHGMEAFMEEFTKLAEEMRKASGDDAKKLHDQLRVLIEKMAANEDKEAEAKSKAKAEESEKENEEEKAELEVKIDKLMKLIEKKDAEIEVHKKGDSAEFMELARRASEVIEVARLRKVDSKKIDEAKTFSDLLLVTAESCTGYRKDSAGDSGYLNAIIDFNLTSESHTDSDDRYNFDEVADSRRDSATKHNPYADAVKRRNGDK